MMRPKNALDPESQPWARQVESELNNLAFSAKQSGLENTSAYKSLNASLKSLGSLISAQAVIIAEQSSILSTQSSILLTQADLIASQVAVDGDSDRQFAFTLNAAPTVSVGSSVTLTKPSWATRAVVTVIGTGYLVTNTTAALPRLNVDIDGDFGMPIDMARVDAASAVPYSSTNAHTVVLDPCPSSFVCRTLFYVINPANYYTGEANRMSQTSATVTFTR